MAENANRAQMSREELLTFYAAVIRTPADRVPAGSPVIQAYEKDGEGHVKLRICDKTAAGAQPQKMNAGTVQGFPRRTAKGSIPLRNAKNSDAKGIGTFPALPISFVLSSCLEIFPIWAIARRRQMPTAATCWPLQLMLNCAVQCHRARLSSRRIARA